VTQLSYRELFRTLQRHEVRFVVIGGIAGVLWGADFITLDLDICYSRGRANITALVAALTGIHARVRDWPAGVPSFIDERTLRLGDTMTFDTDCGPFDCLGTPSGTEGFDDVVQRAANIDVGEGIIVKVASIDDIIRMKRSAGRPKDLLAVEQLKVLKKLRNDP
jgi:hypothetical protein